MSGFQLFMDFLKSNRITIFYYFISQGIEFQMTGPKHLIELFPKYSVLIFDT